MIGAPELLAEQHGLDDFDCGQPSLNAWLKKRAIKANRLGGSARTYVVCDTQNNVVAYYALATGAVNRDETPGKVARNMPDPVPVVLLSRLAVDRRYKGQGIGSGLVKDAFLRVLQAADAIGIRAVLVHAVNESARSFYLKQGFYEAPHNDMTLMLTLTEIARELAR